LSINPLIRNTIPIPVRKPLAKWRILEGSFIKKDMPAMAINNSPILISLFITYRYELIQKYLKGYKVFQYSAKNILYTFIQEKKGCIIITSSAGADLQSVPLKWRIRPQARSSENKRASCHSGCSFL